MCKKFRALAFTAASLTASLLIPTAANAQNPPAGAIFDLVSSPSLPANGILSTYTQFNTSFVADNSSEYVSFAFREQPAYFAFSNPTVSQSGSSTNLLANPLFEGSIYGQNCNHNNSLGCPPGWSAWIQPVDVSAIGQIATASSTYGCNVGPQAGTNFWCDGSVQGYDAIYQQLTGLTVGQTYNINWYLEDDSGSAIVNPQIDMLVYAGDQIPVGTVSLATPEPSSLALFAVAAAGLVFFVVRRRRVSAIA